MKRTLMQYVTLGVMLLLLVLIVSMYPEQNQAKATGQKPTQNALSKLSLATHATAQKSN